MRVCAGKFKGRVLVENKYDFIRPTADMVKQAIFNKLNFSLSGARVLDLCAGTGALGIEALSRGAREVIFVDCDRRSVQLIKQNLQKLGCPSEAKVIQSDAIEFCKQEKGQFDIILLDPPYKCQQYVDFIKEIYENNLLADGGIIVVEQAKEDEFDFSQYFALQSQKTYGIKKKAFYRLFC